MSPSACLSPELESEVSSFLEDLRQERVSGSLHISLATVKLTKRLVGQAQWNCARDIMELLRNRSGGRQTCTY